MVIARGLIPSSLAGALVFGSATCGGNHGASADQAATTSRSPASPNASNSPSPLAFSVVADGDDASLSRIEPGHVDRV